jgi:hypothetical protein
MLLYNLHKKNWKEQENLWVLWGKSEGKRVSRISYGVMEE